MNHFAWKSWFSARPHWPASLLLIALSALLSGSAIVTYNYDAAGRLVSVTYDDGSTVTYTLDAAGNRKTLANAPPTPVTIPGSPGWAAQSASQVKLTWTASTGGSGSYSYNVYRAGTQVATTGVGAVSYIDSGLSPNTQYSYTVLAVDGDGNQSASTAAITPTTCPLPTMSSFAGTTVSSSQINLGWQVSDPCGLGLASSPSASYKIYRDGSLIATITTPATNSYPDTGLPAGSAHNYTLYAYDTGGNSSNAAASSGTYPLPSISTFSGSAASQSSISLTWSASDTGGPGGLTYSVISTAPTPGHAVPNCTGVTAPPCTDSSLSAGTNYSYQLTATDSKGDTATATASQWTTPSAPGTPSFASITSGSATMNWSPSQGTVSSYSYSIDNGAHWTSIAPSSNPSVSLTGLLPGTSYPTLVYASNSGGNSTTSSATLLTTPGQPGIPQFSAVTQTSATITWGASAGIVNNYSYRLNTQSTPTVTTATTASVSGLSPGTTYTVFVYGSNTSGNSTISSNAFTTLSPPPGAPSLSVSPTLTYAGNPVTLNIVWTVPTGTVNHYTLSRSYNSGTPTTTTYPAGTTSTTSFDSGVKVGSLTWQVHACSSSDESICGAWSNAVVVTVKTGCPPGGCP